MCVCYKHTHTHTLAHRLIYRPVAPAETVARVELSRQCQRCEHQGGFRLGLEGGGSRPTNQHQDDRI